MKHFLRPLICAALAAAAFILPCASSAQVNAEQVTAIGRNVLSMEDYVLAIQYFNLAIKAKPYLSDPYFFRALAKVNLDDYKGAEEDCTLALEKNKFKTEAYKLRGFARLNLGRDSLALADFNAGLRYAPYDRYFLYYKAIAHDELKQYESSDSTYTTLLRAFPRFDDAYMARARSYAERGDTTAALTDLSKALDINRNILNAYLLRADIESQRKQWDDALTDINEALKLEPRMVPLYINRAFIRYNSDDYFGAMSDYNYALELEPDNTAAIFNRALLRTEVKDLERAAQDFSRVLELDPSNFHATYNRGLVLLEMGKHRAALADFEATVRKYPKFYPVYYALAEAYQGLGDMRRAVGSAHRAEELVKGYVADPQKNVLDRPTIDAGRANSTGAAPAEDESEEEVMERFNRLVTVDPSTETHLAYNEKIKGRVQDRDVRVEPEPLYAVSLINSETPLQATSNYFRELDDFNNRRYLDEPIYLSTTTTTSDTKQLDRLFGLAEAYSRLITAGRGRPADYIGRALAYTALRNYEAAIADVNKAEELAGEGSSITQMVRAYARYAKSKMDNASASQANEGGAGASLSAAVASADMVEAMADFDKALRMNPRLIYAWFDKGNIYYEARDYTAAVQCYTEALSINPDFGQAYFNRALCYLNMGNRRQAFADLSKAGELGVLPSYNLLKRMR